MYNIYIRLAMIFQILKISNELNNSTSYNFFPNSGNTSMIMKTTAESKLEILENIFKKNVNLMKLSQNLDIVFLIDASSSVGEKNFRSELKFVKKILSDVAVDSNHTRVAIVTFSSPSNIIKNVDEISRSSQEQTKCLLLNKQLKNINYSGGETFTAGAFQIAKEIFDNALRNNSKKVLFLITDGYSSGGDPIPVAEELKNNHVMVFTIGIESGNYNQLYELSSFAGESNSYLLNSFKELESLARRALHVDLKEGIYIAVAENQPCNILCPEGDCCDSNAVCTCGTTSGHYACICQIGYYGSGLRNSCTPCASGTYSNQPNQCLPCPDSHHTTVWPAYGLESCKCKNGYRTIGNNECEVLKCPNISLPEHGYFVKKNECISVFNSACGIRCEVGYTLVGSSIRLCQPNSSWSGNEPICEVKTCPQLSIPKFGKITCRHADLDIEFNRSYKQLPVDTVCSFECEKDRIRIGSKKRTCLPLSTWDGLKTTCKAIKCDKLPQIRFGKAIPNSCNFGKQEFGKTCKATCNDGFKIKGPTKKKCVKYGTWDSKFEDTSCIDVTPPELECPNNVTANTLPGKKYGQVYWQHPNVTDNSALEVLVWVKPVIHNASDFKFQIGETPVTYFAQDVFHNIAKCTFFVLIEDDEIPVIQNCADPAPFLTSDYLNGANITWEEPYIYDNSQEVKISRSHEFGYFKMGTTTVTYTAVDGSGNTNICAINITVEETSCEFLLTHNVDQTKCNNQGDNIHCTITCQEGYAIPLGETDAELVNMTSFICNYPNAALLNEERLFLPCSETSFPMSVQDGEVGVLPEISVCEDTMEFEQLKDVIESTITNEICIENCTIDTESECGTEINEEVYNTIIRRRRSVFEEVSQKNKNKRHRKKISMKFQVRGRYLNETHSEQQNIRIHNRYNVTIHYNRKRHMCQMGFVRRKNICVQCPKGTFHNQTANKCESCSFGYYNDKLGQTKCVMCPLHYSTNKLHSKNSTDCKEMCPPGTFARRRYLKYSKQHSNKKIGRATLKPYCTLCAVSYHQPEYGQLECVSCPNGFTTASVGSITLNQCIPTSLTICSSNINICNNGTCVAINDYEYTCNCPESSVGINCEKMINDCMSEPCANGGTCKYLNNTYSCVCKEGMTGKFCEDEIVKCNIICLNNGTCVESEDNKFICLCPTGYGGKACEIKMNYCNEQLCQNNSTCIEEDDTFKCQCINGYIGRRCNILPCDYKPCEEFYICINNMNEYATKSDFSCVCPDGFTGRECRTKLNHCQDIPCLNGGSCSSNSLNYSCSCTNLYHGSNCQYMKNSNYLLYFQRYDTNSYIKLDGFNHNITEITACLWVQTSDSFNYGTLISYATKYIDNSFTLMDYSGLVLYVNNDYIVTDVILNDGYWHHVCTTWQSTDGMYKIYVDGYLAKNGIGLSKDMYIQGNGNMIIGQEQDSLGGKFSLSESFIGKMCCIDIWSKTLKYEEILIHFAECSNLIFGNLYAWPEMQNFAYGDVQILESSLCNKCEEPKPVFNGKVKIVKNIAYYSCFSGYELNMKEYIKGRRCTRVAKWEGFYEPYCKKVSCGYPGFVKNGYQIGNSYYFQDKIKYNCYSGFTMIGNSTIICGRDGIWFPNNPQCLGVQCTAFKKPTNSEINIFTDQNYTDFIENITKFEIGTQIEVICSSDTDIDGENIITCTENGTWDHELPECKKKRQYGMPNSNSLACPIKQLPAAPNNGYVDLNSVYAAGNGTTHFVEYKCRPGYKLYGDNITTCIIDGYWTQLNTTCQPITCISPQLLKNMVLKEDIKKAYSVGNMLSFQCEEGYSMFRNGIISCLPNGKWSKIKGKCIKKSCRKPNLQRGTVVQGKSFLYNNTVTIMCSNGLSYKITCNKHGVWETKTEAC